MANIIGTEAGDHLNGTPEGDTISGLGGYDMFILSLGRDTLDGGEGYDTIYSNTASLGLTAGPRSFTLTGNRLFDGTGLIDTVFSGFEQVQLTMREAENVTFDARAAQTNLMLTLGLGTHSLIGSAAYDEMNLHDGVGSFDGGGGTSDRFALWFDASLNANPIIATQAGGTVTLSQAGKGDVTLRNFETIAFGASNGASRVDASAMVSGVHFYHTAYADTFIGGAGDDVVSPSGPSSGAGDSFTGGGGADTFGFGSFAAFAGATITDLEAADSIDLYHILGTMKFIGTAAFSGVAGEVRYEIASGKTLLIGDVDGDKTGESVLTIANGALRLVETMAGSKILRVAPSEVRGTAGNDDLEGTPLGETVLGLDGHDSFYVTTGHDVIDGGAGDDGLNLFAARIGLPSGPRFYTFTADHLSDASGVIDTSFSGVEHLYVNETASSGVTVDAHALDIRLSIVLGEGAHDIVGGSSLDQISVSNGSGSFDGGAGYDGLWLSFDNAANGNTLFVTEANGTNRFAQAGRADIASRNFETLGVVALGGALRIDASASTRAIDFTTTAFADTVVGGAGNSRFHSSQDAIGAGDIFTGGEGSDSFGFYSFAAMHGATITDFSRADQLDVRLAPNARFIGAAAFSGTAGEIRYIASDGRTQVVGDANGDGVGDSVLTLNGAEFVLRETWQGSGILTAADNWIGSNGVGEILAGTALDDTMVASIGDEIFYGGAGDDTLIGDRGNDTLSGQDGKDDLQGGDDNDWLDGGKGDDYQSGGMGHDSVWGGEGGDLLTGGEGDDTLAGGTGMDTVSYADAVAGVEIDLSIVEDQHTRGAGTDTLSSIENLLGSAFDDVLAGNGSANLFRGGAGNDRFVFDRTILSARDGIVDFATGDLIDIRAVEVEGGDPDYAAYSFLGDAAFSGGNRQLRATGSGTEWLVEGDINGDRVVDFAIHVTTVVPGLGLSASDFLL